MASEYQLTATTIVIRNLDQAFIPDDPMNRDRQIYTDWVANGGVPDEYIPPDISPPPPSQEEQILFDHENRLRTIEGEPLLELDAFISQTRR